MAKRRPYSFWPAQTMVLVAAAALSLAPACARLDNEELTDDEWSKLQQLSGGRAEVPPASEELECLLGASGLAERVLGLGLPPADCSNWFTLSPFVSDLTNCPDAAASEANQVPPALLAQVIQLGRQLYFDPTFSGKNTHRDTLGRTTPYARGASNTDDANVACADCHDPAHGGIDTSGPTRAVGGAVSVGAGIYDVNSQATVNAAYYDIFYWNGRSDSLWTQITAVNESAVSMNSTRNQTAWKVWDRYWSYYSEQIFSRGIGDLPAGVTALPPPESPQIPRTPVSPRDFECKEDYRDYREIVKRVYVNFAKIIAAYEQTLVRANSPFDQFVAEGRRSTAISAGARRGARLFVGKAACYDCHNGKFFSDSKFHNVGVPQTGPYVPTFEECGSFGCKCDLTAATADPDRKCVPWGAWDGLGKLRQAKFRRDSEWSDDTRDTRVAFLQQLGLARGAPEAAPHTPPTCPTIPDDDYGIPETLGPWLVGAWRTPTLRDVAVTGPYMHNGLYETLEEVVWHYNQGGSVGAMDAQARQSVQITALRLTEDEQRDLVEFLRSLTSRGQIPRTLTGLPPTPDAGTTGGGTTCATGAGSGP
jgi:cytochrome c peroxidase